MRHLAPAMLLVVAAIHLLPLVGAAGGERLAVLYGLGPLGPDLEILMRHRAVLFGLLGSFLLLAIVKPVFRGAAFVAGFVSVISFLVLAVGVGDYNEALQRVVIADAAALACLVAGFGAHLADRRSRGA